MVGSEAWIYVLAEGLRGKTRMKLHFVASGHEQSAHRFASLTARYGQTDIDAADIIVVLGGDGQMLHMMRESISYEKPLFGLNCGHVGFLMNDYADADNKNTDLIHRIEQAEQAILHPLALEARQRDGSTHNALAINEVSLLRQTHNAAHCAITVNGRREMEMLVCDGVLLATPQGSTAYNLSAHGPILPVGAELLALTPISAFRPRRWRGALLPAASQVKIEVLDPDFRPQSVTADNIEFRDITEVNIHQKSEIAIPLLYDPGHGLSERIISEQFAS